MQHRLLLWDTPPGLRHQQQVPCTGHRAEPGPRDSRDSCSPRMGKFHCGRGVWLQGFPPGQGRNRLQLGSLWDPVGFGHRAGPGWGQTWHRLLPWLRPSGRTDERAGGDFLGDISVSRSGEGSASVVASLPWRRAAPGAQPHSALPCQERLGGACQRGTLQPPEDRGTEKPTPGPALGVWAGHKYVSVLQCSKQPLRVQLRRPVFLS